VPRGLCLIFCLPVYLISAFPVTLYFSNSGYKCCMLCGWVSSGLGMEQWVGFVFKSGYGDVFLPFLSGSEMCESSWKPSSCFVAVAHVKCQLLPCPQTPSSHKLDLQPPIYTAFNLQPLAADHAPPPTAGLHFRHLAPPTWLVTSRESIPARNPPGNPPQKPPWKQVHLTGTAACVPSAGASNQLLSEITAISARRTLFNAEKCIF